ncbi:hypothetical protein SAMN04489724_4372 [Algoriphagus locisalis]|uniref:Lipocalin-like domain-containing protein n=1 Tax=Algoriphagus locisalis TaxID=305507 RepID=A0A1I7DU55_9BACT|nr:hypothetical protein [Algoriphagus locisalis]SFU15227.1 hypothetical protein SAMN04489724_4372 [Algoriphagus locisalis]
MLKLIYLIVILFSLLNIDPEYLLGSWKITKSQALENLVLSESYKNLIEDQQEKVNRLNKLVLDSAYYRFTKDSVFWSDVNQREEKLVHLKGRWLIKGDTLYVFKTGKVEPYPYLIEKKSTNEISMRFIFPDGQIARSRSDFQRKLN